MTARPDDTAELRKGRGAFFTPPELADFLVAWAVRDAGDRVLEPSCGEAAFLAPAAARLVELRGGPGVPAEQLHGVDVHAPSAAEAARLVAQRGGRAAIDVADFFDVPPPDDEAARFDAVIGNPPYVRYQQFQGENRAKALRAALACGVRLTRLASSWAAFLVHATRFLKADGRLGLVLPAELLAVSYAAPVRRFLLENLARVRLVLFEELVFPGVLEEVVLLLAEGRGRAPSFEVVQARDLADLPRLESTAWSGFAPVGEEKWTPALLPASAFARYRAIAAGPGFEELGDWGSAYLGAVTGNNRYFTLTAEAARAERLPEHDLERISPPGSKHLRGLSFPAAEWRRQADAGAAVYLFHPKDGRRSRAAERKIAAGEAAGVHAAYKCRVRAPWWRVPLVAAPDLLFTYMDHERPRLVANKAGVRHLNSLYGVRLRAGRKRLGLDLLPLAALSTVTLLGAEVVGRSYGGGLLKLEPREADRLPVPSKALLERAAPRLRALRPQVEAALERGELAEAVALVDRELLERELELDAGALDDLRRARRVLFSRRTARGRGAR
jgi:tRNA1(Val) A37 N6-methylase TrmN6